VHGPTHQDLSEVCFPVVFLIAPRLTSHSVSHGSEVTFVYGWPASATLSSAALSLQMIDYWISFATSLDPNDGRGNLRILFVLSNVDAN
jgi:carboxylesterase type B